MSLTITVSDDLAVRLKSRAEAEQVPVEELALRILQSGIQQPLDAEQWRALNRRRVALIDKRFTDGLAEEEQAELQRLQEMADKQVEELDAKMHGDLSRMEAAAQKVLAKDN